MTRLDPELVALLGEELLAFLRTRDLEIPKPLVGRRHGMHRSTRGGGGLEFRDHRPYVPGDDPRRLDWRAAARRDRLIVRDAEAEDELVVGIVVDANGGMNYGEGAAQKWVCARALVATLAAMTIGQGDRLAVTITRGDTVEGELARPSARTDRLRELAIGLRVPPAGGGSLAQALEQLLAHTIARGVVFVVSDFLDPRPSAPASDTAPDEQLLDLMGTAAARGHAVVMVQVLHRDELEFPFRERRLLLEDLRGRRDAIEGSSTNLRDAYLERLSAHLVALRDGAERRGVHLVRTTSDASRPAAISDVLVRLGARGQMAAVP